MVAAEDEWDVWSDESSVADPTDPAPAVAARARAKLWRLLDPVLAAELDMAEKTDPSPAVAVTGLTAEKRKLKDRAVVEPNKRQRKRSVSKCTESDDSSPQEKSTVAAGIGSEPSRKCMAKADIEVIAEGKRVDASPLRHEKDDKTEPKKTETKKVFLK